MNINYQDVGQVIPGAKKFNFINSYNDLKDENFATQSKYAVKNKIWKNKKSYSDDPYCDYLIKQFRATIRNKPQQQSPEAIKNYVDKLSFIRDLIEENINDTDKIYHIVTDLNTSFSDPAIFCRRLKYYNLTEFAFDCKQKQQSVKSSKQRSKTVRGQLIKLDELKRVGEDYRLGYDASAQELLDAFKFRGIQFGNWVNDKERISNVNHAFDALKDLSKVLNITDSMITLDGKLALALGARGSGREDAHYEPEFVVINLTRFNGAGSLAHEWGHFLDHYLAELNDKTQMLTDCWDISYSSLNEIVKILRDRKSKYYQDSLQFDKAERRNKRYWSSTPEMFARAFSCYIIDKLESMGLQDDYLATEPQYLISEYDAVYSPNPVGNERAILNKLFDDLIAELKSKGILK